MKVNVTLVDAGKNYEERFQDSKSLREFLAQEAKYWKSVAEQFESSVPQYLGSAPQLKEAIDLIDRLEEEVKSEAKDEGQASTEISQKLNSFRGNWIWSKHSWLPAYINVCNEQPQEVAAAFRRVVPEHQPNIDTTKFDNLKGALLAYEALTPDSEVVRRKEGEEESLDEIRRASTCALKTLFEESEEFKSGFNSWLSGKKEELNNDQLQRAEKFDQHLEDAENRVRALENQLREKLRLEGPAKYWSDRARVLRRQALLWLSALAVTLISGIIVVLDMFDAWLLEKQLAVSFSSIQGIIIFGVGVAAFAYLVRTLSRLVFSSFHLQRDAEEREQLTHLYLALTDEKDVEPETRQLVLQALFSRADSGLLLGDSAPTLPSSAEILRLFGRSGGGAG